MTNTESQEYLLTGTAMVTYLTVTCQDWFKYNEVVESNEVLDNRPCITLSLMSSNNIYQPPRLVFHIFVDERQNAVEVWVNVRSLSIWKKPLKQDWSSGRELAAYQQNMVSEIKNFLFSVMGKVFIDGNKISTPKEYWV